MKLKNPRNSSEPGSYEKGLAALKKIGLLIGNFAVIYGLFRLIIMLAAKFRAPWIYYTGTVIYALAFIVLFVAFFILNGHTFGSAPQDRDSLPESWTDEEKDAFLEKQPANRKKARALLLFIFPLVLTAAISFIELNILG